MSTPKEKCLFILAFSGFSTAELARILRVNRRQITRWRSGQTDVRNMHIIDRIDFVFDGLSQIRRSHWKYLGEFSERMVGAKHRTLVDALAIANSKDEIMDVYKYIKIDIDALEQAKKARLELFKKQG